MKRILFFILCIMPLAIMAQPGTLDKTFGDDGISFNVNIVGVINKVGLQSDGKIIAAGSGGKDISSAFLFERYNTDGSIDSSFGTDGHAGNLNELDQVFALAIQPDDGFIAMGHPSYKVGLARYKKDGELDSSFGVNGIVITSVSPNANSASDMLVQPDGKIVVCGYIINAPNEARQLFLVRYLPNGSLDNSFGDGGIVIVGEPNSDYALYSVNAIALQPNGQIVVAAYLTKGAAYRFNTDGTLDTDFGNNGLAYFQSANAALRGFIPNDVVIQTDGKIVSGGNGIKKGLTPDYYMAAACIDTDGGIDSSFGDNGIQHILFSGQTSDCRSMALQNNGKIILAGRALGKMAMARLNADGSIDSSFGESGQIVTTEAEGSGASNSVVLQNDNKILLGGYTYVDGLPPLGYFLLARYNNGLTKKQIIFAKIRRWWQHHNGIMWNNVPGIKNYAIQRSGDGAHWSTVY
ncbi:MAG: hypothetical protein JST21_17330, partial [Bacteroidetes bacterium]|nr:hypothetical protein [Bacteroidota bacterium]